MAIPVFVSKIINEAGDILTSVKTFIKRHPVLSYYVLTFTISWGGVLLLVGGPGSIPGTS